MAAALARPPRRNDDRVVLHFDYDCFYAQVVQNRAPAGSLAGRCVGVTQKSILATCNYEARRRGVRKLMRIAEARRICPDIVLVDGEDLSPFRDASKQLYRLMCTAVGSDVPVERLGLDEVFVDATALIDANIDRLLASPGNSLSQNEFFYVPSAAEDSSQGFSFDARSFAGCVIGDGGTAAAGAVTTSSSQSDDGYASQRANLHTRLLLGSHLAAYLRLHLEHDAGYTSSAGIATSKLLSKLAGKQNKPANQTTLASSGWLHGGGSHDDENAVVWRFMDALPLCSVPGIGYKTSLLLSEYIRAARRATSKDAAGWAVKNSRPVSRGGNESEPNAVEDESDASEAASGGVVTVADVRAWPGMSAGLLDSILSSSHGADAVHTASASGNIPSGSHVWCLLHGVDDGPVRGGRDLPSQISIEDTYAGPRQGTLRPDSAACVTTELRKLATSLLRRMHVDLLGPAGGAVADRDPGSSNPGSSAAGTAVALHQRSWLVRPRTLRLTLRPQLPQAVDNRAPDNYFARMSRSVALPTFVLSLSTPPEQIVDRLVATSLVPMFRKLAASVHAGRWGTQAKPAGSSGRSPNSSGAPLWTVGLLNVCVANMAPVAGHGDDIASMFRRQDGRAQERLNHDTRTYVGGHQDKGIDDPDGQNDEGDDDGSNGWDAGDDRETALEVCDQCGHFLPPFARAAHARYHLLGD